MNRAPISHPNNWLQLNLRDPAQAPSGFAEIVSDDFSIPFHSLRGAVSTTTNYANFVIDLRLPPSLRFVLTSMCADYWAFPVASLDRQ